MNKRLLIFVLFLSVPTLVLGLPNTDRLDNTGQRTLTTHGKSKLLVNQKPYLVPESRDLLFDQNSPSQGAFGACQADSAMAFYPRLSDNFVLTIDADIDSIVFWGGYWNPGYPGSPLGYNIEFYPDSGGGNGPCQDPIYFQEVMFTETQISGDWCVYEGAIPPFSVAAGDTYWLVTQMLLTFPPQFGTNCSSPPDWGDGQEGYFKSEYFGYPTWVTATTVFGSPYENGFQLYGSPAAADTFTWDFEDGWQGWTHTSGSTYPAAWGIIDEATSNTYVPAMEESLLAVDDDAAGSGVTVIDTAMSPVFQGFAEDWLYWLVGYNNIGSDWVTIILRYFDGTWNETQLVQYTADIGSYGAVLDSVDVSGFSADSFQLLIEYNDGGVWAWWAEFDNIGPVFLFPQPELHDVGVQEVVSPPEGTVVPGDYDVTGRVRNYGDFDETFDVVATVWDTTGMAVVFGPTTVNLASFPAGGDTNLVFGQVTFDPDAYYYTEIYTDLSGDENPANDTASVFSQTALALGDIIFEMDAETPTGDIRLLGVEFDGTYFYCTGARDMDSAFVYVLDTLGNLIWQMPQPSYCHGTWGWRDLAFDNVYAGPDRIDTLYGSVNNNVDPFGIDLTTGAISYYTPFAGPENPNRALAFYDDSTWFYTANFSSPCYWFSKSNSNIGNTSNSYAMYGAAYDTDTTDGGWIWWHSQDDPGTGWDGQVEQYDPVTQSFTGVNFGYEPTITVPSSAGGASFYEGFRGADVLFTMVQGTPDVIIGLYIREHQAVGVEEGPASVPLVFKLSQNVPNPFTNGQTRINYATTQSGPVSLKIYDNAGRLVRTLVDAKQNAGRKTVTWNGKDNKNNSVSAGVYFYKLTAGNHTASRKMIVVK